MHLDVQDLKNFYYRSTLGRAAQAAVRGRLTEIWPEAKGQTVAGFGFAVPLLRPYLAEARRVVGLMPGPQGVMPWPSGMPNVSVLTEETAWPLETGRVDKLVVMHGLETSERPTELLDECWRVLGPGGKAIFVVPNRAGLWSRSDNTPFGHGRPYTLGQLETQLRKHHFLPEYHCSALYQPPSFRRFWLKSGSLMERTGARLPRIMAGGVFLVEVSKRVHPPRGSAVRDGAPRALEAFEGMRKPVAKPV
ncbi:methyltransferase domain-containing protein [Lutimaribacter marinistellae]|uniref:Methyltransferase domain-containing protein n=1 Tax=Lutimaribacter marinistellae TaxID=1820329 RepID=A0ABV7TKP5_9RHOB